jgi:hypothetical protein
LNVPQLQREIISFWSRKGIGQVVIRIQYVIYFSAEFFTDSRKNAAFCKELRQKDKSESAGNSIKWCILHTAVPGTGFITFSQSHVNVYNVWKTFGVLVYLPIVF